MAKLLRTTEVIGSPTLEWPAMFQEVASGVLHGQHVVIHPQFTSQGLGERKLVDSITFIDCTRTGRIEPFVDLLSQYNVLAVDTETTGLDPLNDDLVLVTLATSDRQAFIFFMPTALKGRAYLDLCNLLESDRMVHLLQYAAFDYGFLMGKMGIQLTNIYDTRSVEIALGAPKGERSLARLVKKYLNEDMDKSTATTFTMDMSNLTEEQMLYAARDALCLHEVARRQGMAAGLHGFVEDPGQITRGSIALMQDYLDGRIPQLPGRA